MKHSQRAESKRIILWLISRISEMVPPGTQSKFWHKKGLLCEQARDLSNLASRLSAGECFYPLLLLMKWFLLLTVLGRWSVSHRSIALKVPPSVSQFSWTCSSGNTVIQYSQIYNRWMIDPLKEHWKSNHFAAAYLPNIVIKNLFIRVLLFAV